MNPLRPFRPIAGSLALSIVTAFAVTMVSKTTRASDPQAERPAITVNLRDLNLATPDGVAALKRRIRDAAKQVCGPAVPTDLLGEAAKERCTDEAVARALAYIRVPGG
jgi:UrcA family protein